MDASVDGPAVPSASAALRTSFAPNIATMRAPSPASSTPSGNNQLTYFSFVDLAVELTLFLTWLMIRAWGVCVC